MNQVEYDNIQCCHLIALNKMIISTQVYQKIGRLKYQLIFIVGVYMFNA